MQPRNPRLTMLLRCNKARLRAKRKREARRLLAENGYGDMKVTLDDPDQEPSGEEKYSRK